jgi:hypothetical protein
MKRFCVLSLSAVLALGVASTFDSSFAQQRVTRDQLVGTWTLISCTDATRAVCVNPNGRTIFESNGQFMLITAVRGRPKCSGACGRAQLSGDQYKAIAQDFGANFGSWSFNDADQTLTESREAALFPNTEGTDFKWKVVSLTGDELRMIDAAGHTDIWRRVR